MAVKCIRAYAFIIEQNAVKKIRSTKSYDNVTFVQDK